MDAEPALPSPPPPPATLEAPPPSRGVLVGLGLVLVVLVYVAGAPSLDAPWILGDEFIFIVDNPDVNPAADPDHENAPLARRLAHVFSTVQEDLYQPLPIATYALDWEPTGGSPLSFRRTDVLIHALNALLLWLVLRVLLSRLRSARPAVTAVLAWMLALLWALHPMLITAYAGDMGRTHLMSATFALLSLGLYLSWMSRGRTVVLGGALVALLLAMLCKPIPGCVLLVIVLEAAHTGWRRTARSPRVWIVAGVCAVFAVTTYWTSSQSGLIGDASKGLFGDPVARSALAVWIYFRNLLAPLWLSFWYLPDPRTGWGYPLVWLGLGLAAASAVHAVRAWRRPDTRFVTVGWAWCWALLLPVVGLIGARESAAVDRYFYQPLMGIAAVVGVLAVRTLGARRAETLLRITVPIGAVLALAMLAWDLPHCRIARSPIRRATRLIQLNPGDPRALEALAVAYDFARTHPLPADEAADLRRGTSQFAHFAALARDTLTQAAHTADLARFFPGPEDLGPFRRRLSYRFLLLGDARQSLAQAEEARKLLPDEFVTWKRLAHAYQALGRLDEARAAYERCEQLLPSDPPELRAAYYTDCATLLMYDFDRDAEACPKFAAAVATGKPPLEAKLGLAVCEIRYGQGAEGFRLLVDVLEAIRRHGATPLTQLRAGLALGEYRLRSHHWDEAFAVYEALIQDNPTDYTALRGLQETCLQSGRLRDAVLAWQDAAVRAPDRREFNSFLVWTLALADNPSAAPAAEEFLAKDPDNPLACFALMLTEARAGRLDEAVSWVRRARAGTPIPKAREFERAAAAIQVLTARKDLPPEATLLQAAIYLVGDFPAPDRARAREIVRDLLAESPPSRWQRLAEQLQSELSDLEPAP